MPKKTVTAKTHLDVIAQETSWAALELLRKDYAELSAAYDAVNKAFTECKGINARLVRKAARDQVEIESLKEKARANDLAK